MGNSADAVLFYGYVFNDEDTYPWQDPDDYEVNEAFADKDWDESHFYVHLFLGKTEEEMEKLGWRGVLDLAKGSLVEVGRWGYLLETQHHYLIHPKDDKAAFTCCWSSSKKVTPDMLVPSVGWDAVLKEYAEKMGIDLKGQEPAWHMTVSYG